MNILLAVLIIIRPIELHDALRIKMITEALKHLHDIHTGHIISRQFQHFNFSLYEDVKKSVTLF